MDKEKSLFVNFNLRKCKKLSVPEKYLHGESACCYQLKVDSDRTLYLFIEGEETEKIRPAVLITDCKSESGRTIMRRKLYGEFDIFDIGNGEWQVFGRLVNLRGVNIFLKEIYRKARRGE